MSTHNHCYSWVSIAEVMLTISGHEVELSSNDDSREVVEVTDNELDYIAWGSDGGANLD